MDPSSGLPSRSATSSGTSRAIERYMYAGNRRGTAQQLPRLRSGARRVDMLPYWNTSSGSTARPRDIIGSLTDADLERKCRTRKPCRDGHHDVEMAAQHGVRARGAITGAGIYLMLGMLDVATPPLFGLTSEEVRARTA